MAQPRWSETVSLPLPRSLAGVRLAGQEIGLTQEEVRFSLDQRRRIEELSAQDEEVTQLTRSIIEQLATAVQKLPTMLEERLQEWQPFLVELAIKVAERVTHTALERGDYDLAPVVTKLLERARNVTTNSGITVMVNPADLSLLLSHLQTEGLAMDPSVRFDTSGLIERGSCQIQTDEGRLLFNPEDFFAEAAQIVREELASAEPTPE